jgi:hypothetical protein
MAAAVAAADKIVRNLGGMNKDATPDRSGDSRMDNRGPLKDNRNNGHLRLLHPYKATLLHVRFLAEVLQKRKTKSVRFGLCLS